MGTGEPTMNNLAQIASEQLAQAVASPNGRASHTIVGGSGHTLRQVVMALRSGTALQEHENPGEATVQVLAGRVLFSSEGAEHELSVGDLVPVPPARHSVEALADAVILLTVSKPGT
jgi:quercetin dioxygenase-like cupin family protein